MRVTRDGRGGPARAGEVRPGYSRRGPGPDSAGRWAGTARGGIWNLVYVSIEGELWNIDATNVCP